MSECKLFKRHENYINGIKQEIEAQSCEMVIKRAEYINKTFFLNFTITFKSESIAEFNIYRENRKNWCGIYAFKNIKTREIISCSTASLHEVLWFRLHSCIIACHIAGRQSKHKLVENSLKEKLSSIGLKIDFQGKVYGKDCYCISNDFNDLILLYNTFLKDKVVYTLENLDSTKVYNNYIVDYTENDNVVIDTLLKSINDCLEEDVSKFDYEINQNSFFSEVTEDSFKLHPEHEVKLLALGVTYKKSISTNTGDYYDFYYDNSKLLRLSVLPCDDEYIYRLTKARSGDAFAECSNNGLPFLSVSKFIYDNVKFYINSMEYNKVDKFKEEASRLLGA